MKIANYEKCIKYVLQMKGIAGETFKDTDLRVYHRHTANPQTVFQTLRKGGIIIPTVKASLLGEYQAEVSATVIISANQITDMVSLYVPKSDNIQIFPIAAFVEAWEAAGGHCTTAFEHDAKTYMPKTIDLEYVELPENYEQLQELIAANAHDIWALERQSEGWTYGPKRDDSKLETPDMVPYDQLPESEKDYDRKMAADTLRMFVALGYKIEKSDRR